MTILETTNLLLRPFRETDAEALYDSCCNPNLGNNAGWKPHESIEESEEVLRTVFLNQETVWAITDKSTGELIGSIGLMPDPKRENPAAYMIGYWLREERWGKGLTSESAAAVLDYGFRELKPDLITGYCYPHNTRSRRLLERLGFINEGTLIRAEVSWDGNILDHVCYRLTREEYLSISK